MKTDADSTKCFQNLIRRSEHCPHNSFLFFFLPNVQHIFHVTEDNLLERGMHGAETPQLK
jgi:hypothetical protein